MPRIARKRLEGKYFHIMVQGIDKEMIFPDNDSKGYYLSLLEKAKVKNKIFIFAFCIMGNHAHLLMKAENVKAISSSMHGVNREYGRYYNNVLNRVGYVFRGRYRSEAIEDQRHLINCLAYIHNNPVKAKIVKKAEDYGYSSYKNYLKRMGIVDFEEAKKYYDISGSNIKAVMKEKSNSDWIEHDDKEYEDSEIVLEEIVTKYDINGKLTDYNLAARISKELMSRSGVSLRKCAEILGVGRERLRLAFLEIKK